MATIFMAGGTALCTIIAVLVLVAVQNDSIQVNVGDCVALFHLKLHLMQISHFFLVKLLPLQAPSSVNSEL